MRVVRFHSDHGVIWINPEHVVSLRPNPNREATHTDIYMSTGLVYTVDANHNSSADVLQQAGEDRCSMSDEEKTTMIVEFLERYKTK